MALEACIVEDNPDLRRLFTLAFSEAGFDIRVASDGYETLEYLYSRLPDVLILDVNIPGISGLDVLKHVRDNQGPRQVYVIIVTGNATIEQSEEAKLADRFLVKPVNPLELVDLAKRLIDDSASGATD